ncbi:hypothetical protein MTX20_34965 [Bradyrhizobium sp. ISRA435]|nr:hypothetical protein MTX20_34965 [Bradyrhizobium sp. ISRA435]
MSTVSTQLRFLVMQIALPLVGAEIVLVEKSLWAQKIASARTAPPQQFNSKYTFVAYAIETL